MYRKKLTYSFFTIPVAVISFGVYDWQRRRAIEKLHETQHRINRISENPINIQDYYTNNNNKFPWLGKNIKELNSEYGFKPIELVGQFDHANQILVEKNKEGEEGYDIITPFYCYKDENGKTQPLLVNRGWIPFDFQETKVNLIHNVGEIMIKGVVYKGDESNKYSKKNYYADGDFVHTQKPEELASYLALPNREVSGKFVIKQIEFNPVNKTLHPVVLNVSELAKFPITAETNQNYALFWKGLTFFNIFSNMLVWIYF